MLRETEKIRKRYNRASVFYDLMEAPMEAMALKSWREEAVKELQGRVLEVGVGTGKNLEYYPEGLDVTGIDFSDKMLDRAKKKALLLNKNIKLLLMDAQDMEFPDDSFDTVYTTCVFCSVPDPVKGLQEIRRVCKPGGKIVMIEHVRSEKKVLGLIMDIMNPLVVNLYGANINRRTIENIGKVGYSRVEVTDLYMDIVKKITIVNDKTV